MKRLAVAVLFALFVLIEAQYDHPSEHESHQYGDGYRRAPPPPHGTYHGSGFVHGSGPHHRGGGGYGYKKVLCPKLSDPANGDVKVSGLYPGQKAVYSCDKGFVLVGLSIRKCLHDGKWSQEAPICKRINCGPLPDIANGAVSISPDTRLGSTATYTCTEGFNLVGEDTRRCQASGNWSGVEPSCQPVDCGPLSNPKNGWVHIAPDTLLGATAIYRCKLGYELSSTDPLTCQTSGQWSSAPPTCDPISCGEPPAANANGEIVSSQGTSLRDQTTYGCNDGYFLVGTATIYCQNDKTYSDAAPVCQRVDCGDLSDIANGQISIAPDTKLGSTATYSCDVGFNLEGDETRTCQTDGTWSGSEPNCVVVDCGTLPDPKNGWVHISPDTTFQSVALYRCKLGYELSSDDKRVCQASGNWSGVAPTCDPIECGKQPEPNANSQIVATQGTSLRDQTTYACNDGYTLEGTATIYCQNDKTYSDAAPVCRRVDCGDLSDIANGQISIAPDTKLGSTATYSCDAGFNLEGDETRTCQTDGTWSGSEPNCVVVDCGSLSDPKNGWVHIAPDTLLGATAIYRCKLGYELSSTDPLTCQTSGQWSSAPPTCDPISCGQPPAADANGEIVSSQGTSLRDQTTYGCNNGYFLVGTATIYCQNDKTYSDAAPVCQPVDCGAPDPADPNGSLNVDSTTFQSQATYSCNAGHILVGQAVATCQANGEWSSEAPICQPVDCGKLPAPKNGAVSFYPGTIFSSTATFVCRRGFRLVGSKVRSCQASGKWSGVQPVCKKIQCPKLKPPQYGRVYVSGTYPGDYAVYDCGYGYDLVGKRRRVCLYTGKWSGSASDCVRSKHHYGGHDGYGYGSNKEHDGY